MRPRPSNVSPTVAAYVSERESAISRRRRVSGVVVAGLLALALGLVSCGGQRSDEIVTGSGSGATSTSVVPPGVAPHGAPTTDASGDGRVSDTVDANGTGVLEAGEPTSPPARTAAGVARPVGPGVYDYDTEGSTTRSGVTREDEPLPAVTTLRIEPADGASQVSTRDLRDANGRGSATTTTLQYRDDGVYLEGVRVEGSEFGLSFAFEFRPDPPQLLFPTGVAIGHHTVFALTSTNGGIKGDVTVDITGEQTLAIEDVALPTLQVRTRTKFSGDVNGESTSTSNLAWERSLTVHESVVTEAEFGTARVRTSYVATLRSLESRPAP